MKEKEIKNKLKEIEQKGLKYVFRYNKMISKDSKTPENCISIFNGTLYRCEKIFTKKDTAKKFYKKMKNSQMISKIILSDT